MIINKETKNITEKNIYDGFELVKNHPIFGSMITNDSIDLKEKSQMGKNIKAFLEIHKSKSWNGKRIVYYTININKNILLSPKEWAFTIAHLYMHLIFKHFHKENIDKCKPYNVSIWNKACDIQINKFLNDIKFGSQYTSDINKVPADLHDEESIYYYLLSKKNNILQEYGVADLEHLDMLGLNDPILESDIYHYSDDFIKHIRESVSDIVGKVSDASIGVKKDKIMRNTPWGMAAMWFLNSYPLLGGLASSFKIIDDDEYARKLGVDVAAIDIENREIIIRPMKSKNESRFSEDEWKFILAHEYLHAGLSHQERCQGRNKFLWNVACDFVINGWLKEMNVGVMPNDLLYDEKLKNMSAENVYDEIVKNFKKNDDYKTFKGYGVGDILDGRYIPSFEDRKNKDKNITLDDFCKNALMTGLEYHLEKGRGLLPAGLVEEIRTLAMPPIPWDVELAKWFDLFFPSIEKKRSYARPSRRQSTTPNIPRPSYYRPDLSDKSRTFGVVVDTSGSMASKEIGMALGSIASYSESKDVYAARVIFCDANAYDAGYMCPSDIAGKVEVYGRGGTVLQPAIDLLEKAEDFPKDGPILIITDGKIEDNLKVKYEHAFLIPRGGHLPFKARGKVFYFKE